MLTTLFSLTPFCYSVGLVKIFLLKKLRLFVIFRSNLCSELLLNSLIHAYVPKAVERYSARPTAGVKLQAKITAILF